MSIKISIKKASGDVVINRTVLYLFKRAFNDFSAWSEIRQKVNAHGNGCEVEEEGKKIKTAKKKSLKASNFVLNWFFQFCMRASFKVIQWKFFFLLFPLNKWKFMQIFSFLLRFFKLKQTFFNVFYCSVEMKLSVDVLNDDFSAKSSFLCVLLNGNFTEIED